VVLLSSEAQNFGFCLSQPLFPGTICDSGYLAVIVSAQVSVYTFRLKELQNLMTVQPSRPPTSHQEEPCILHHPITHCRPRDREISKPTSQLPVLRGTDTGLLPGQNMVQNFGMCRVQLTGKEQYEWTHKLYADG
jgi:hypothetical protein